VIVTSLNGVKREHDILCSEVPIGESVAIRCALLLVAVMFSVGLVVWPREQAIQFTFLFVPILLALAVFSFSSRLLRGQQTVVLAFVTVLAMGGLVFVDIVMGVFGR
jgi:hypothetical protein